VEEYHGLALKCFCRTIEPSILKYDSCVRLSNARIGERGQVAIPKEIRDQSGLGPGTEVNSASAMRYCPQDGSEEVEPGQMERVLRRSIG
jgi:hypothetical protein